MTISIDGKKIGAGFPCYIIAEAGANANSDINLAYKLIDGAVAGGAEAIKFQHYKAEKLVTKTAPKYYVDTLKEWQDGVSPKGCQYDEFSQLDGLGEQDWREIIGYCREKKITFLSTPFDFEQLELLEKLDVPAYKIASADITYLPFLKAVAEKGKPIILSTGASTLSEIADAVDVIEEAGNKQIVLLHCTLHYPCHNNEVNLKAMETMRKRFPDYPIGLSDHSLGIFVPILAAAFGANVVEKHYTVDKNMMTSTDHFMSVDSDELKEMTQMIHQLPVIFGQSEKRPIPAEALAVQYARRSIIAARNLVAGQTLTSDDLVIKRPGTGIPPRFYEDIVGKCINCNILADTVLQWNMIE